MDSVKGFLKVTKINGQLPLPFSALFSDVAYYEDLVCASPLVNVLMWEKGSSDDKVVQFAEASQPLPILIPGATSVLSHGPVAVHVVTAEFDVLVSMAMVRTWRGTASTSAWSC